MSGPDTRTESERRFEAFCAGAEIPFKTILKTILKTTVPTPDYEIVVGGVTVVCEVKEIQPSKDDLAEMAAIAEDGIVAISAVAVLDDKQSPHTLRVYPNPWASVPLDRAAFAEVRWARVMGVPGPTLYGEHAVKFSPLGRVDARSLPAWAPPPLVPPGTPRRARVRARPRASHPAMKLVRSCGTAWTDRSIGVARAQGRRYAPAQSGASAPGPCITRTKPANGTAAQRAAWSQMARGRRGPSARSCGN